MSLIFCLEDLAIDVNMVLKSPTIIVFPSISPFMSVIICFMYSDAPVLGVYMLTSVISSYIECPLISLFSVLVYLFLWSLFQSLFFLM